MKAQPKRSSVIANRDGFRLIQSKFMKLVACDKLPREVAAEAARADSARGQSPRGNSVGGKSPCGQSLPALGDSADIDHAKGLADKFRYWLGASGDRYVFTEIDLNEIDEYTETVVLLMDARRRTGLRLAYLGEAGSRSADQSRTLAAAKRSKSIRAFVHLLAEDADRRRHIIADLAAAA